MTLRSLLAACWTALIVLACLAPHAWIQSDEPPGAPSWLGRLLADVPVDKVVHFAMFAGFGLLWRRAGASTRATWLGGLALALFTELGQFIIPALERSADLPDLLADLVGLGLGLAIGRPRRAFASPVRPAEAEAQAAPPGGPSWTAR